MAIFYKTNKVFEVLLLLLKKARGENLTVSVCMATEQECRDFSSWLWVHSNLAHGFCGAELAQFVEKQPIFIDSTPHCKDVVVVCGDVDCDVSGFQKVIFINRKAKTELIGKFYEYNDAAKEISEELYFG